MSAESILNRYALQQGWDADSIQDLLLRYIENQASDDAFEDFLREAAAVEDHGDDWVDHHSVNCLRCGRLVDERNCTTGPENEGSICPDCQVTETGKRIIARFHPQAWIDDYAYEVDPEGPVEFDVTDEILAMGREEALKIQDDQWDSDHLADHPGAPEWIREWQGPFWVEVQDAIAEFFEEDVPDEGECAHCGETIEPGEAVASPQGSMHDECAYEHEQEHPEQW